MTEFTRAQRTLNKLTQLAPGLTESGKDWLVAAIDPFHDSQLKNLQGWPDLETGASVVRLIKETMTITAPASASGNWDCEIVNWPFQNTQSFMTSNVRNNQVGQFNSQNPTTTLGGLQAFAVPSGTPAAFATNASTTSMTLPPQYQTGSHRIVGMGFEVVNTTAPLYKQGQVTCFKMMENPTGVSNMYVTDVTNTYSGDTTTTPVRAPPSTVAQAMLLPGSRQWDAAEGCYMVSTFMDTVNKPYSVNYQQPIINTVTAYPALTPEYSDDVITSPNTEAVLLPLIGLSASFPGTMIFPPQHMYPIHMSGAYFTGLSNQTTLSVTRNVYIESFPGIGEPDILVLGTPSAEFDYTALFLYSHAMSVMPVGVKVSDNEAGSWFSEVMGDVIDFLSPLLKSAGGIPAAIGVVGDHIRTKYLAPPNAKGSPKVGLKPARKANVPANNGAKNPGKPKGKKCSKCDKVCQNQAALSQHLAAKHKA